MEFKEYRTDANSDGSVNIRDLEIFRLCERDGKKYDADWFKRFQQYHALEKMSGYLPSAVVGHDKKEGEERHNIGLVDNVRLKGDLVYADVLKVPQNDFRAMKERRFPNRSVELHPNTGQLLALAFLGKTRPFHKLPVMEFHSGMVEPVRVDFEEGGPGGEHVGQIDAIIEKLKGLLTFNSKKDEDTMTPEEIQTIKDSVKADLMQQFQDSFDTQYAAKFKEEFGVTPDEFKKQQADGAKKLFTDRVKLFGEELKKKHSIAPALVDGFMIPMVMAFQDRSGDVIQFSEGESGDVFKLVEKFAETLVGLVKNEKIVVNFDETATHPGDKGNPNLKNDSSAIDIKFMTTEEAQELDKKIVAFQQKNNIKTYEEAAEKFLAEN